MLDIKINLNERKFVKYDEDLFNVYVLDYGDNYHRLENEPSSEFEASVRKIKARYRDIQSYYNAKVLYEEYMYYLAEKYGGEELFKRKRKAGLINEYIPPKPRIKKNKELKFLKKNKIILGRVGKYLVDEDALDDIIDLYSEGMNVDNIEVEDVDKKEVKNVIDKLDNVGKNKYKSLKSQSFKSDSDFLDAYFRNKNYYNDFKKKKKKKGKKKKDKDKLLISDFMKSEYYHDDDSYSEDSEGMVLYNNIFLSNATSKELDVYHKLNELGWNSYKIMKKGEFSSRITDMFKPPKKKKKGKKKKTDGKYDGLIIDILQDNGFDTDDMDSFAEFQKDMLNMTSANIFR